MSAEIVEAVKTLGREKGISEEKLMGALEDALLSRLQEAARRRALRPRAHGPRLRRLHRRGVPAARGPRGPAARRGRGAGHRRARAPRGPGDRRGHHPGGAGHRSGAPERLRGPDRDPRRHAARLRADRRADRQAGDPAADPRGRARHDVRGVPRPRGRADHRHRPAVRLPLHARAAARARRGAAAEVRAGRRRALRPFAAHQGRDQGGLLLHARPEHHRLAAATRS